MFKKSDLKDPKELVTLILSVVYKYGSWWQDCGFLSCRTAEIIDSDKNHFIEWLKKEKPLCYQNGLNAEGDVNSDDIDIMFAKLTGASAYIIPTEDEEYPFENSTYEKSIDISSEIELPSKDVEDFDLEDEDTVDDFKQMYLLACYAFANDKVMEDVLEIVNDANLQPSEILTLY